MLRLTSLRMVRDRRILASLAIAAPLVTGGLVGGGVASAVTNAAPVPNTPYTELVDGNAGKCLEVAGGSTADGARVQQWGCWGGSNQLWGLVPSQVPGYYTVRNYNSGKCLDVSESSTFGNTTVIGYGNGQTVQQWGCWNGPNQLWARFGPMLVSYEAVLGWLPSQCLDVANASTANGARVQEWGCWDGPQQQWRVGPVGAGVTVS